LWSGRNVFEELGRGFTLIALDAAGNDLARIEEAAYALKVPLKTIADTRAGGREAYDCKLILVRPDQFIAWCGDAVGNADALIARAAGQ
jgi:hypothetical protein